MHGLDITKLLYKEMVLILMSCLCVGSKVDGMLQTSIASSPIEKRIALDSQIPKSSELADSYRKQSLRANYIMEKHAAGVAGPASRSLPRTLEHDLSARSNFNLEPSYFMEGNKLNLIGSQGENSLFSSSLSELFSRKCMSIFVGTSCQCVIFTHTYILQIINC